MNEDSKKQDHAAEEKVVVVQPSGDRRDFLKLAAAFSAILAVGGIAAVSKSITERVGASTNTATSSNTFPRVKVANLSDLQVNQAIIFNYPLDNESNILVKLGRKVQNGVGPDGDIAAFSQVCQHLGCLYSFLATGMSPTCNSSYKAAGPEGYCCCHGSVYDFTVAGKVIGGPSPRPQPMVILEVDNSGNIFATGMTPPAIFGHNTGSSDVASDLQGGNPVG